MADVVAESAEDKEEEEEEERGVKVIKEKAGTATTVEEMDSAGIATSTAGVAAADSNSRDGALPHESSIEGGEGVAGGVSMAGIGRSLKQADS